MSWPRYLAHLLKNSPIWSIEVNTTLGRRNNRSYIQIQVNSVENEEKQQHRFNRCPYHRSIRCLAEVPTPCRSISLGSKLKSSQVTRYHRLNRWSQAKHRCIRCTLFQRACLVDHNSSSAPVEPTLQIQPSVHWMYYVPENLFELISEPLQHRLN